MFDFAVFKELDWIGLVLVVPFVFLEQFVVIWESILNEKWKK